MPYSVYQHWDPLKVCVVGRSYPPEFYSWIKIPHVRDLFERIALETEEDFQAIISKLQQFGVEILRPELENIDLRNGKFAAPPMTPRDTMIMVGQDFYCAKNYLLDRWRVFYQDTKDPSWPWADSFEDFMKVAKPWQLDEVLQMHGWCEVVDEFQLRYRKICQHINAQGNKLKDYRNGLINGAMVSRIGRDLYFATKTYDADQDQLLNEINQEFPETRNHVVNTGGHGDGTYCPVCPGLIISLQDVNTYKDTFPGWEVVYLPGQSWHKVKPFLDLKQKNRGRWWIPGFEYDDEVVKVVDTWLSHWVGYVEETVFDVNMLIIDPQNVMVFNENEQVFRVLNRYGITPHIVPFRHRYFWDGGIHCVTLDLHRQGHRQDFFPDRD